MKYITGRPTPGNILRKTYDGSFWFKAGNHARNYRYGPGFQNHAVAKMAFNFEGQILESKGQMGSNFQIQETQLLMDHASVTHYAVNELSAAVGQHIMNAVFLAGIVSYRMSYIVRHTSSKTEIHFS